MYKQLEKDVITIAELFPEFDDSAMKIEPLGALPFISQFDEKLQTSKFCSTCSTSLILKGRHYCFYLAKSSDQFMPY